MIYSFHILIFIKTSQDNVKDNFFKDLKNIKTLEFLAVLFLKKTFDIV